VQKVLIIRDVLAGNLNLKGNAFQKSANDGRAKFNISIGIYGRIVKIGFSERENSALSFKVYFINIRLLEVQKRRDIRRLACTRQNENSQNRLRNSQESPKHE